MRNRPMKSEADVKIINEWMKSPHATPVRMHSSRKYQAVGWLQRNLEPGRWKFERWTDLYEHTAWFPNERLAYFFETRCLDSKEDRP